MSVKIKLIVIGKCKDKNIKALITEYLKRTKWNIEILELEAKLKNENLAKEEEAKLILSKIPEGYFIFALNEVGKQYNSPALANLMQSKIDQFAGKICFIIGGASGLTEEVNKSANMSLSLGLNTYPHMLARLLLIEQIYRVWTIINNKNYHK